MKQSLILLVTVFFVCSCSGQKEPSHAVTADVFQQSISNTPGQILDVRTQGEYNSGHIAHALLADWTNRDEFTRRVGYLDKNKPVYIYCLSGSRSAAAAQWLRNDGFADVVELSNGLLSWKRDNKPLEGSTPVPAMSLEEYQDKIAGATPVLVDFGAPWCPPCVKMEPVLTDLEQEAGDHFRVVRMDAGVESTVMRALGIEALPVFIVYRNGNETWRHEGLASKQELLDHLEK